MITFSLVLLAVLVLALIAGTMAIIVKGGLTGACVLMSNNLGTLFSLLGYVILAIVNQNE